MNKAARGRPREFDGTPVSVRLPKDLHDQLSRKALRADRKLSEVIREGLTRFVSQKRDTNPSMPK